MPSMELLRSPEGLGSFGELGSKIHAELVRARVHECNTQPTTLPAPQKQYFGTMGMRHVLCICGLPNTCKSFVAFELGWYLEFFHGATVEYFDVAHYAGRGTKEACARALLEDVQKFLDQAGGRGRQSTSTSDVVAVEGMDEESIRMMKMTDSGRVAIVTPPSLPTMARLKRDDDHAQAKVMWQSIWSCTNALDRDWVRRELQQGKKDSKLMFIEIEVTDEQLLRQHMDAAHKTEQAKLEALHEWFAYSYTPLGRAASPESSLSFLKYKNFRDMETHKMHGYLRMRIAQFLSVLRPWRHTIYLSRHGESTYNVEGRLGGDPGLSPHGESYARRLGDFTAHCVQLNPRTGTSVAARLWTSSLIRTIETAKHIPHPVLRARDLEDRADGMDVEDLHGLEWQQMRLRVYRNLDELFAGTYDGMRESEIEALDERFQKDRKLDKLATRYPHGESYLDLITRLEPLIHELHSYEEPLVIVSHQATLRVLRAYLMRDRRHPRSMVPKVEIPQHTIMKITWDGWHFQPKPALQAAKLSAKEWPPPPGAEWQRPNFSGEDFGHDPKAAPEPTIGCEEWFWLGPDPKRSDGQQNL